MRTNKPSTALLFASYALLIAACSSETPSVCGEGTEFSHHTANYCLYREPITEQGFTCPASLPNAFSFGDFRACAMEMDLPQDFEVAARKALFMTTDARAQDTSVEQDGAQMDARLTMDASVPEDAGGDCFSAWQNVQSIVTATDTPSDANGLRFELTYRLNESNQAEIELENIAAEAVVQDSDGPFSTETHSGHWAELRDDQNQTLYTRQVFQLIPESVEVFPGPDSGFSNVTQCPEDGVIRLQNMDNIASATQLVLFQDEIDGKDGPTIEFARFYLPGR